MPNPGAAALSLASRLPSGTLALGRLDVVRELGLRAAARHRADMAAGRRWAPEAKRALYREIWIEAAERVGCERSDLGSDFMRFRRGARETVTWFHHVQLDDPVTLRLALDKAVVQGLLEGEGIPTPESRIIGSRDLAPATEMLGDGSQPLVVKPAAGTSGGHGVTCAVDSVADLRRAALHAARWCDDLLVERHIEGDEYRFLFLDGELLDVIRRRPPHVTGDGRSSVAALISLENERRERAGGRRGISALDVTLDNVLALDRAGLALDAVPPAGVTVAVKSTANANSAEDNTTVDPADIAPALVAEARRAVGAVRLRLAGVDLITPDLGRPLLDAGGAVIEVNGTPGLHYHYLVRSPTSARRVAVPVLRTLLGDG